MEDKKKKIKEAVATTGSALAGSALSSATVARVMAGEGAAAPSSAGDAPAQDDAVSSHAAASSVQDDAGSGSAAGAAEEVVVLHEPAPEEVGNGVVIVEVADPAEVVCDPSPSVIADVIAHLGHVEASPSDIEDIPVCIDIVPDVYGPPPEVIDDIDADGGGTEIDDWMCVYGPNPEYMEDGLGGMSGEPVAPGPEGAY